MLTGTIWSAHHGEPLIGASVGAFCDGRPVATAMTDIDGKFRLALDGAVQLDGLLITARFPGFKAWKLILSGSVAPDLGAIRLPQAVTLSIEKHPVITMGIPVRNPEPVRPLRYHPEPPLLEEPGKTTLMEEHLR